MDNKVVNSRILDMNDAGVFLSAPQIKWNLPIQDSVGESSDEMMNDIDTASQISSDSTYFSPRKEDNECRNINSSLLNVESHIAINKTNYIHENHNYTNKSKKQVVKRCAKNLHHKISDDINDELSREDFPQNKWEILSESQYSYIVPGTCQESENVAPTVLTTNTVNTWQGGEENNIFCTHQAMNDDNSAWDGMIDTVLQECHVTDFDLNVNFLLSQSTDFQREEITPEQDPPIKLKLSRKDYERESKTVVENTQTQSQPQLETDVNIFGSDLAQALVITDSTSAGDTCQSSAVITSSHNYRKRAVRKNKSKTKLTKLIKVNQSRQKVKSTPCEAYSNRIKKQPNSTTGEKEHWKYKNSMGFQHTEMQNLAGVTGISLIPKKNLDEVHCYTTGIKDYWKKNTKSVMINHLMDIREEIFQYLHGLKSSLNKTHASELQGKVQTLCTKLEAIYLSENHSCSQQQDLEAVRQMCETLQKQLQGIIKADEESQVLQGVIQRLESISLKSLPQLSMESEDHENEACCVEVFAGKSMDSYNEEADTNMNVGDDSEVNESEPQLIDFISPISLGEVNPKGTTKTGQGSTNIIKSKSQQFNETLEQESNGKIFNLENFNTLRNNIAEPTVHLPIVMNHQSEIPTSTTSNTSKKNNDQISVSSASADVTSKKQISLKPNIRTSNRDPRLNKALANSRVTRQNTRSQNFANIISKEQPNCIGFVSSDIRSLNLMPINNCQDTLAQKTEIASESVTPRTSNRDARLNRGLANKRVTRQNTRSHNFANIISKEQPNCIGFVSSDIRSLNLMPINNCQDTLAQRTEIASESVTLSQISSTKKQPEMMTIQTSSSLSNSEIGPVMDVDSTVDQHQPAIPLQPLKLSSQVKLCNTENQSKPQISQNLIKRRQTLTSNKYCKAASINKKSLGKESITEIPQIQWQALNLESASENTSQAQSAYENIYDQCKSKGAIPKLLKFKNKRYTKDRKATLQRNKNLIEDPQHKSNDIQSNISSKEITSKGIFPRLEASKQTYNPFSQNSSLLPDTIAKGQKDSRTAPILQSESDDCYLNAGMRQSQQASVLRNTIFDIKSMWLPSLSEFTPNSPLHEAFWNNINAPWPEDWKNDYEDW